MSPLPALLLVLLGGLALAWALPSTPLGSASGQQLRASPSAPLGSTSGQQLQALFVLHDAGETFALQDAIRSLSADGVAVQVLPLGQPATDIVLCQGRHRGCAPLPATTLGELGVDLRVIDGTRGRGQLLPPSGLRALAKALRPAVVVTGMNYAMQLQIGEALAVSAGAAFAAYLDGLRLLGSDSDVGAELQRQFAARAREVWIPSGVLWPSAPGWGDNYRVVGQPTLQVWQELSSHGAELRAVRETLFGKEAAASGVPAAIWFGGYGPGYEEALRAWCEVVRRLSSTFRGLRFAHAIHPGSDYGDLDRKVLSEEGVRHLVAVVPDGISGSTAALACNLTASQGSTGGVQSIFAGKPALFLDPARAFGNADNLGVRIGLVPSLHSASAAESALRQAAESGWSVDASKLAAAGVPSDPVRRIRRAVQGLLSNSEAEDPSRGPGAPVELGIRGGGAVRRTGDPQNSASS